MKKPSELTNKDIGTKLYSKELGREYTFIGKWDICNYRVLKILNDDESRWFRHDIDYMDTNFTLEKPKAKPIVDWSTISPWFKYVAMDRNDIWFMFKTAPTINNNFWKNYDCIHDPYLRIPDEYAPKFDGDWKDSLVERPN